MITDRVTSYYKERWGVPSSEFHYDVEGTKVLVVKWDADAHPDEVAMYATVGSSALPMEGHRPDHRVEFLMGVLPPRDEVASSLAVLASHHITEHTSLEHGHTVSLADPLWKGTRMHAFLIMRPIEQILPALVVGQVHVDFLQAIPIYDSELAFKKQNGADALVRRWKAARVPFWDGDRMPDPG